MGEFQNIFKRIRIASGITQAAMAKQLGISRSTIGMYETGAREPDFETLQKIADYFNVDTDYLLGRTDKTTLLPETIGMRTANPDCLQTRDQAERDLLVLYRNGDLSDAEKAEVIDLFKSTLDVYYKAKGIKKSE